VKSPPIENFLATVLCLPRQNLWANVTS